MTTFADREHAIEAHQAVLDLMEFRARAHRTELHALDLGRRLGFDEADCQRLAQYLVERSIVSRGAHAGADWHPAQSVTVSQHDRPADIADYARQSWAEFVISQLLQLFGSHTPPGPAMPALPSTAAP